MMISFLFVRTFEKYPNQLSAVIATQSISEVGIQVIAVSQACSSLELDLHLQDVKEGRSRGTSALASPGGHARDNIDRRKNFINLFLLIHIVVLVSIPALMFTVESIVLAKFNP